MCLVGSGAGQRGGKLEKYPGVIGSDRSRSWFGFSSKYDSHWMVENKGMIRFTVLKFFGF